MSTVSPAHALSDSVTMLRRSLLHWVRYPAMMISTLGMPVFMMLLFVYVLGGAMNSGVDSSTTYVNYLVPGIILLTAGIGAGGTTIAVCTDMSEGIIARFRTMAISRSSVLVGHVVGSVIQTLCSVALVVGAAALMGFRPSASAVEWLAVIGVVTMLALALTWLVVPVGLLSKTAEGASNGTMILWVLPFLSSAFAPTDSMSGGIRWFAENQPFTPIIETLRGLLTGTEIGNSGALAVGWCAGLTLVGYVWAVRVYNRDPSR